jgi:hypothetical protein
VFTAHPLFLFLPFGADSAAEPLQQSHQCQSDILSPEEKEHTVRLRPQRIHLRDKQLTLPHQFGAQSPTGRVSDICPV